MGGGVSSRAGKYEEKSVVAGAAQEKILGDGGAAGAAEPKFGKMGSASGAAEPKTDKNAELMVWICHQTFWIFGAKIILILFDQMV